MVQVTPIRLDDGTVIYIEATETVQSTSAIEIVGEHSSIPATPEVNQEITREDLGRKSKGWTGDTANRARGAILEAQEIVTVQGFQEIERTIRAYTNHTLNAFKQVSSANVNKVTLEFGIEIGAEAGLPYVTKGTAKSNLKITVECSFPKGDGQ